jgi:hypothetical protein
MKLALSSILSLIALAAVAYCGTADAPSSTASAANAAAPRASAATTVAELESIDGQSPERLAAEGAALAGRGADRLPQLEGEVEVYRREMHAYLSDLRAASFPGAMRGCKPRVRKELGQIGAAIGGSLPFIHGRREALVHFYFERAEGLIFELAHRLRRTLASAADGAGNDGCIAAVAPPLI